MKYKTFIALSRFLIIYLFSIYLIIFSVSCTAGIKNSSSSISAIMREETILLKKTNEKITVRVDFIFQGDFTHSRTMAFPETEWFVMNDFRAYFNEKELKVKKISLDSSSFELEKNRYPALFVFNTHPSDKKLNTHSVSYTYTMPYHSPGSKSAADEPEGLYAEYILLTGRPWEGPIGKITAIFDAGVSCDQIIELADSYRGSCKEGIWKLILNKKEPVHNIRLIIAEQSAQHSPILKKPVKN